ncbi:hypothetical protein P8452_62540 [Trifolium repens]|nr:hypothetical protein P8452_62540 [Trifolium repens]
MARITAAEDLVGRILHSQFRFLSAISTATLTMSCVKHDSVDKDFASLKNKKLKLHDNKDLGDNSHHLPVPMSCHDDPKVAKNDNSLKPNVDLFSEDEA